MGYIKRLPDSFWLYSAWLVTIVGTLGSLYFSEIRSLAPCKLCWYQRIFLYPQVLVIAVGLIVNDKKLPYYILPLAVIGAIIAAYHTLLYYAIIPQSLAPCSIEASCVAHQYDLFGVIGIPLMSLVAFAIIIICMIMVFPKKKGIL